LKLPSGCPKPDRTGPVQAAAKWNHGEQQEKGVNGLRSGLHPKETEAWETPKSWLLAPLLEVVE
jgi:hypothetical protein